MMRTFVALAVLCACIRSCLGQNETTKVTSATTTMTSPVIPDNDPSFTYPLNTCICQLDQTLRSVVKYELLQEELAGGSGRRRRAAVLISDYFVPPNLYHGVFYNSSRVAKLCQCLAENVLATKLNLASVPWDEDMSDPTSDTFKALAADIQEQFDAIFNAGSFSSDYVVTYLTRLERAADSSNSTVATLDMQCSASVDPELVRQFFVRATRRGTRLGSLSIRPPFFAAVQGSSSSLGEAGLEGLLEKAAETAEAIASKWQPDTSMKYFYYVTCPAFLGMGFVLFGCLFGLREKGCLCRDGPVK